MSHLLSALEKTTKLPDQPLNIKLIYEYFVTREDHSKSESVNLQYNIYSFIVSTASH